MTVIKIIIQFLNIIFAAIMIFCGIIGIIDELFGSNCTRKMLSKLHIPLSYNQFVLFTVIIIVVFWVTYVIKNKIS